MTGSSKAFNNIEPSPYTYTYLPLCISADDSILLWTRNETARLVPITPWPKQVSQSSTPTPQGLTTV